MDLAALAVGFALLLLAAGLIAACLRLPGASEFLLAVYVLGFTIVVTLTFVLSAGGWLTRGALLIGLALVLVAAAADWSRRGRPSPPSFGEARTALCEALTDPVLAVLALAVAVALAYLALLGFVTPPNDYDALWYHLSRAAFWKQQHGVAFVEGANDHRINATQPNTEIAVASTMILGRSERYAFLVQFASLIAAMLAIGVVARRIGLARSEAIFGALAFATLPVVALQASTALNDIVVAALLVSVLAFIGSDTRVGWVLGALSLGLAIGTKPTAVLALPVLGLAALLLNTPRRWGALLATGLGGVALGSTWWIVNLVKTGEFDADTTALQRTGAAIGQVIDGGETARQAPVALLASAAVLAVSPRGRKAILAVVAVAAVVVLNSLVALESDAPTGKESVALLARRTIDAVDPSGSVGRDRFLYAVVAGVLVAGGAVLAVRRGTRRPALVAGAAAVVVLLALALEPLYDFLRRGYQKAWIELGHPDLAFLGFDRKSTIASPFQSWYGPLGLLLFAASVILVARELRRRTLPVVAIVLATAPVLFLVVMSATLFYSLFDGRYAMFAVALAASTWGLTARVRALAWAACAVAVTTLALSLVHYHEKPSGISVLSGSSEPSVWTQPRWRVMSVYAHGADAVQPTLDELAAPGSTVGLRIRAGDLSYLYFGRDLDRLVRFVGPDGDGLDAADWLVVSPDLSIALCRTNWRLVRASDGWRLYRRGGRGTCAG